MNRKKNRSSIYRNPIPLPLPIPIPVPISNHKPIPDGCSDCCSDSDNPDNSSRCCCIHNGSSSSSSSSSRSPSPTIICEVKEGPRGPRGPQGIQGIQGITGPSGSSGGQLDADLNIIPDMSFGTPMRTSTDIFIPVIYPSQNYVSLFPYPLPVITGTRFVLRYKASDNEMYTSTIDSGNDFNSNYVWTRKDNNIATNDPLTGIVLSKNQSTNLSISNDITFPDNNTYSSVILNIGTLSVSDPSNTITGYYRNYYGDGIVATLDFGLFSGAGPPSQDGTITIILNKFNIFRPSIADISNNTNPTIIIISYDLSYSTLGSNISYIPDVSFSSISNIPYDSNNLKNENYVPPNQNPNGPTVVDPSFYPDASYNYSLIVKNSFNLSSTSILTNPIFYTPFINAKLNNNINNLFIGGNSGIFLYSDSVNQLSSPFFNNSNISINATTLAINTDSTTRGKLGSNRKLMDISASLFGNNASVDTSFNSFPLISSSRNISGINMNILYSKTQDQYIGTKGSEGFYSQVNDVSINLFKNVFPPTSIGSEYNLNITQNYYNVDNNINLQINKSFRFYYDNIVGLPSTSFNVNFSDAKIQYVSGVATIGQNPTYNIESTLTNMSNFFYKKIILTYIFKDEKTNIIGTSNERDLSPNGTIENNTITFKNNSVSPIIASNNTFNKSVLLQIQAQNINGISLSQEIPIKAIFDKPSLDLLNNTLLNNTLTNPLTIQNISPDFGTNVTGTRVYSPPPQEDTLKKTLIPSSKSLNKYTTYVPLYSDPQNENISYSKYLYDASMHELCKLNNSNNSMTINGNTNITINSTFELQVANGLYQSTTDISSSYLDYRIYYNNQDLDYSSLVQPTYRFATFIWNALASDLKSKSFSILKFTIHNFKRNGNEIDLKTDEGSYHHCETDDRILIHYRVEDLTNIKPVNQNDVSTTWVDGNSVYSSDSTGFIKSFENAGLSSISSGNYYINPTVVKFTSNNTYTMINNNDLQIELDSILYDTTSSSFLYLRIGLPTNANYSFQYVSLSIKI